MQVYAINLLLSFYAKIGSIILALLNIIKDMVVIENYSKIKLILRDTKIWSGILGCSAMNLFQVNKIPK